MDKARNDFSKAQLKKPSGERSCKQCVQEKEGRQQQEAEGGGGGTGGHQHQHNNGTTSNKPAEIRCYNCKKPASDDSPAEEFFRCVRCRSVTYCSKACQKEDWREGGHRDGTYVLSFLDGKVSNYCIRDSQIITGTIESDLLCLFVCLKVCGRLNIGDAEQVVHRDHEEHAEQLALTRQALLNGDMGEIGMKFFELFLNSADQNGPQLERTETNMKRWFRRQSRYTKKVLMFQSITLLLGCPKKMLKLPTSPMTIALASHVDPSAVSSPSEGVSDGEGSTPLHWIAESADGSRKTSMKNQMLLGQQLIDAGANVNARAERGLGKVTPLHRACHSAVTTNIDFIKLLLANGADPNAKNDLGETPLMHSMPFSPGAAKCLLQNDQTDPNVVANDGRIALAMLRDAIDEMEFKSQIPDNPKQHEYRFTVSQLRELEEFMVLRGAHDRGESYGADSGF